MRNHRMAHWRRGNMFLAVFLIILCVLLGIGLVAAFIQKSEMSLQVKRNAKLIAKLKEQKRELALELSQLKPQLIQAQRALELARQQPVGTGSTVTDGESATQAPQPEPGSAAARIRHLERELAAAEKLAHMYYRMLPEDRKNTLVDDSGLRVGDIQVRRSDLGDEHTITYTVVNQTGKPLRAVTGLIRFWGNEKILFEEPFLVADLSHGQSKTQSKTVPLESFSRYSVHITGGAEASR